MKKPFNACLTTCLGLFLFFGNSLFAQQQSWFKTYPSLPPNFMQIKEDKHNREFWVTDLDRGNKQVIKIDSTGNILQNNPINTTVLLSDTKYILLDSLHNNCLLFSTPFNAGNQILEIHKRNLAGATTWTSTLGLPIQYDFLMINHAIQTSDGGYLFSSNRGSNINTQRGYVTKINASGVEQWTIIRGLNELIRLREVWNGNYMLDNITVTEIDSANGAVVQTLPLMSQISAIDNSDSTLISIKNVISPTHYIQFKKTDRSGNLLKYNAIDMNALIRNVIPTNDRGYMLTGTISGLNITNQSNIVLVKLDSNGLLLWKQIYGTNTGDCLVFSTLQKSSGEYVLLGKLHKNTPQEIIFIMQLDSLGRLYNNSIQGTVFEDNNSNCTRDNNDNGLVDRVAYSNNNRQLLNNFAITDSAGNYSLQADTGLYDVIIAGNDPYWNLCQDTQQVTFNGGYQTDTLDFATQAIVNCPRLEVDISTPFLRRCFPNVYTINYCNTGTLDATNTYIEIELDTSLIFNSSSIPVVNQNGNIYQFNTGDIAMGACGSFSIDVTVSCASSLGQVHCVEANMYPDILCTEYWAITDSCTNTAVLFAVVNNTNTASSGTYWMVRDTVVIDSGTVNIAAGQEIILSTLADTGSSYALIFRPQGSTTPLVEFAHNCQGSTTVANHVSSWLGLYSEHVTEAMDCQANIGAYDPNDKRGFPEGYGINHDILPNTALNYHIRFQNTGTDTAFTVVIRDTLALALDTSTLKIKGGSHAFTWNLSNDRVLEFTFNNIMLPDSNVNEPLSHGFVKFSIDPLSNLPLGTRIENSAAIYFDFNAPIITNTAFHTINENFTPFDITVVANPKLPITEPLQVTLYPNPVTNVLQIKKNGTQLLQLRVIDQLGREQLATSIQEPFSSLDLSNLPAGIYFISIGDEKNLITKKIIKH